MRTVSVNNMTDESIFMGCSIFDSLAKNLLFIALRTNIMKINAKYILVRIT